MSIEIAKKQEKGQQQPAQNVLKTKNGSSGQGFLVTYVSGEESSLEKFKKVVQSVLGNLKYQIFITILTVYSLFADDFRTAAFSQEVDSYFDWTCLVVMAIFTIQIILSSVYIQEYFLSFFFFLDIISTASIIFDVNFISDIIFSTSTNSNLAHLAAQSKASRAATRAVRIVKLFRIIRIIKLYKNAQKARQIKEQDKKKQIIRQKLNKRKNRHKLGDPSVRQQLSNAGQYSQNIMMAQTSKHQGFSNYPEQPGVPQGQATNEQFSDPIIIQDAQLQKAMKEESKIGKILSQLSIKKIIIVVLIMMFVIPLFSYDLYKDTENAWDYLLFEQATLLSVDPAIITTASISELINLQIADFATQGNYIIQYTSPFNQFPYLNNVDLTVLRNQDLLSSYQTINTTSILLKRTDLTLRSSTNTDLDTINVILNQNQYNVKLSIFNIVKTLFTCLTLLILMQLFSRDIDTLLVEPIEGMMEKLMLMAKDPESAAKQELNKNIQLQTTIISNAIIKIGALLSTVFGSAGAEIIGSNIVQQGEMNPMIEGKKKCAIFGFCDIRHFTEVTEVLQQEILVFVNKIGSLVHESVYRYGGSANKNIGEAFLLVWKIPQDKYALDQVTNIIQWKDRRYIGVLADFAVLGFVKTLVKIHKDPLILQYGFDQRLQQALENYSVTMGFGLHIGWAIEGAIGSQYKIDASYLSPNVNMASRLQAATKQFGVDFLLSEDLYELLTPEMKEFCRNIDRVTVKGSEKPIKLYTVDMNYEKITPPARKDFKYPNPADMPDSESKRAINMEFLKEEEIAHYSAKKFIHSKKQFRQTLVHCLPEDFKKRFELGVKCYLKGKWGDSRLHLSQALKFKNNDGPTKTLLSYMKKFNFCSPSTWKEYRPLTSK